MKKNSIVLMFLALILLPSFDTNSNRQLEQALNYAGSNRPEMEYVLRHFQNDANPLKYQSAVFLIENMAYHYSVYGESIKDYNDIYERMALEPKENRNSYFSKAVQNVDLRMCRSIPDIRKVTSDYLISAINDAVNTWNRVNWKMNNDKSLFFNYVLPYRISNEPLSNWRSFVKGEYKYLSDNSVWSNRGVKILAFNSKTGNCKILDEPSAFKGKSVLLDNAQSCIEFKINSGLSCRKLINLRYNTSSRSAKAAIYVNNQIVDTIHLEPTNTQHAFRSSRFGISVNLVNGENNLTIKYINDPFQMDYIEIASLEKFDANKLEDFSNFYCLVKNNATGKCVYLDTLSYSNLKPVQLRGYSRTDNSFLLQFTYLGYPCWKISPKDCPRLCMEDRWVSLDPLSPVGKYNFLNATHQKWILLPVGNGLYKIMNKDTGLCWESSKDGEAGSDIIVQNFYSCKDNQKWSITKVVSNQNPDRFFTLGSAVSEGLKITDVMGQFEFISNDGIIPPSLQSLCKYRTGTCRDEASYVVALSRSLGIPTTVDFTPHWGNRTGSHSWSVLVLPNGKATPFYMGCAPGDTTQYFHSYIKPKIFRERFQINQDILKDIYTESSLPDFLSYPDYIDVTKEYCLTTNVTRDVPAEYCIHKIAYICVFDRKDWAPVYYGKIINNQVTFKEMGRNILYSLGFFDRGRIISVGNPFYINSVGQIKDIDCDMNEKSSMTLYRKYPFFGKQDFFNFRMSYGKFQGGNKSDFSDAKTFFIHEGITEGCWYEHSVSDNQTYKYLRYLSPANSFCNINELEFYDNNNNKIMGKIIGTQGTEGQTKETVFDGNVLTGFNGDSPDGHWVGLELSSPTKISKVRYMPRNDGNCVEIGDTYQLNIYDNGTWKNLGKKVATENKLIFENIPSHGLYILNDLTTGVEERIFTYNNGIQIWW